MAVRRNPARARSSPERKKWWADHVGGPVLAGVILLGLAAVITPQVAGWVAAAVGAPQTREIAIASHEDRERLTDLCGWFEGTASRNADYPLWLWVQSPSGVYAAQIVQTWPGEERWRAWVQVGDQTAVEDVDFVVEAMYLPRTTSDALRNVSPVGAGGIGWLQHASRPADAVSVTAIQVTQSADAEDNCGSPPDGD